MGKPLQFYYKKISGWLPIGKSFTITKADEKRGIILKINNHPAAEIYKYYLEEDFHLFKKNSIVMDYQDNIKAELLSKIPNEASVVSTFEFMPHLSTRKDLFSFHHIYWGYYTLSDKIYNLSKKFNIYTPIADEVYKILNGKKIHSSLEDLLKWDWINIL